MKNFFIALFLLVSFAFAQKQNVTLEDLISLPKKDLVQELTVRKYCFVVEYRNLTIEGDGGAVDVFYDCYNLPYYVRFYGEAFQHEEESVIGDTLISTIYDKWKVNIGRNGTKLCTIVYSQQPSSARFTCRDGF